MLLRSIKIWLTIVVVWLKRRLLGFLVNPFKLTSLQITALLIIVLLGLLGLTYSRNQTELFRPSLSEGVIGVYKDRDYPPTIDGLLSKGLFTTNSSGQIEPNLAESIESNPDGTMYTVKLKKNLSWVDQSHLRAQELVFNFSGVEVTYPDDNTIVFKLSEAYSPFPYLLVKPVYKENSLIGVGPFFIKNSQEVIKQGYLVKKLQLHSVNRSLSDLVIYLYPNETLADEALRLGEIQAIIGAGDLSAIQNQSVFKTVAKTNLTQLVAIFYNTKDPVLSDDNYRLALSFAAPTIAGETEAHTSLPDSSWAFNGQVKDYLDNPTQAKNYLQKVKNGKDQPVILTTTSNLASVGKKVVNTWNLNGINAKLKIESGVPQNFQALLITQSIPQDPDQYALWHSTQTQTNISKVSNPRIDKDLEDGRKATDSAKRKAIYQDFQKVLLDHAPATFLYFPKTQVIFNQKIEARLMKLLKLQLNV